MAIKKAAKKPVSKAQAAAVANFLKNKGGAAAPAAPAKALAPAAPMAPAKPVIDTDNDEE